MIHIKDNTILGCINYLKHKIINYGEINNTTNELRGVCISLQESFYKKELRNMRAFHRTNGTLESFENKIKSEYYNYQALLFALLQKIEFNKFYFKEMPIGSRKIYANSEDCISSVAVALRVQSIEMNVLMRSSEVNQLLGCDMLGLLSISSEISKKVFHKVLPTDINILISSAHSYFREDDRRKQYEEIL